MRSICSLFVVCVLFLVSCSDKNQIRLTSTNCEKEVALLGNFTFSFDKDLAPDSALNQWDESEYISFDPPISGRFNWTAPNELTFSPERELLPATSYKATFTKELLRFMKKYSVSGLEDISFYTPLTKLESANIHWAARDEESKDAGALLDLYFNYRINPAILKELLSVESDGKKQNFTIVNTNADSKITVNISGLIMEDRDYKIKVEIGSGLQPEGGNNPTSEALTTTLLLPSAFILFVNNVEANHDGSEGHINIFTSQLPVSENLESFLELEPKVSFKTEITSEGFRISSADFNVSQLYNLKMKKGLRGRLGGSLKEEYLTQISFGQLSPSIDFENNKSLYLTDKGAKNIMVKIINVPKVKITISKIYENNLLTAARYGYYHNDSYDDYYEYNDYGYSDMSLGDVIYESEIETKLLPKKGGVTLFNFDFADKLPEYKGIYHITIRSNEHYWLDASKFVSLSDIGLIAKEGSDRIFVFANSIKNAEALGNVSVSIYGNNNQLIGTAATNSEGYAEVQLNKKEFSGFIPAMITAKSGNDFNYMLLSNTRIQTSRFDVGGKTTNNTGLDAFIYAERDIYRPGEKINLSVIVRNRLWKVPGEIPVKIKLELPNGKEFKTVRKTLNSEGSAETAFEISASSITGNYHVEVYTANDILLSTKSILVEEFIPDRIKVTPKLNKAFYLPGDTAVLDVNALNYFGPPAAGRNFEAEFQIKVKDFNPRKFSNYNFYISNRNNWFDQISRQGVTDLEGNINQKFPIDKKFNNMGLLQADFFVTVFDENGRPVNRKSSADILTQNVFYGIGSDGYYYYPTNQTLSFPLIALNKDEKPQSNVQAKVVVIKHDYRTILSRDGQYFRYNSQKEEKLISDQTITLNGENTRFTFVARTSGKYEIRVFQPGASYYVSEIFYCYGWGGTASFEVNTEGNIDIDTDKEKYMVGETAKLIFKAPFNGRMLVTIETDKVHQHFWLKTDNRTATATLNVNQEYLPNAYITATLIKPHEESDLPLTVAHGFRSFNAEEKARRIPVQIFAEKQVRSNTSQKVRVKAAPYSKVTLAAVDEGILAITGYKTPDPYGFFYQKRALEVNAYDMYQLLLPEVKGGGLVLSSTGGDGGMAKRLNPLPNKRVKLISYWSGITDASGNAEANFEFSIPQFSGQVRLMAVAYKDVSFGSAEAFMTVADPLVVSTALPRFLSPKDTVIVPVTITNTTSKSSNVSATIRTTGPVKVAGDKTQTVTVNAKSETIAQFKIVADTKIDVAKIVVEVNGLGEKFVDETDITVRPSSPLQKRLGSGYSNAGKISQVKVDTDGWVTSSVNYELVLSKSPITEISEHLSELVRYPYGCTEQIISAAFPQLYFSDLSVLFNKDTSLTRNAHQNILDAIRTIKMRQLYNGALTLWDDGGYEHWWATVYGAHFLLEAQKAGFDVDKSLLQNTLNYLEFRLKKREMIPYYYNRNEQKQIAPREVAYSLFVLALAGQPQVNTMNYYKSNGNVLTLDSKYMLAAAYALAGDKNKYKELLPDNFTGEVSNTETGGSFASALRDEAISLYVMLEVDKDNLQASVMAKHVSEQLKSNRYFSTQERAFSFMALGKIARKLNETNVTAIVKVNGKSVAEFTGKPVKLSSKKLGSATVTLETSGNGKLYYSWQAEGISADGSYKEEDSYIKVRKTFHDRTGRVIDAKTFKQNELIIIGISLESSFSTSIENIVITDMLPAGFEIENPRTQEIPGMTWTKNASTPTAIDVRDDRINLFVNLTSKKQQYYYAVRAVSPGVYTMGPVSADAMYAGEYHSYHGAGVMKIEK